MIRQTFYNLYDKFVKGVNILDKEKEYIFPMNYKKKEKFLGMVDYKTLVVLVIFSTLTFFILKNIAVGIGVKVTIFIMVVGFFSILMLVGVNGENMLDFLVFVCKYLIREKVYVYRKVEEKEEYNVCEKLLKRGFL